MRSLFRALGLLLFLGLSLGSLGASEPPDAMTDSLKKYMPEESDGENSMVVLPTHYGDQTTPSQILNPAGLEAHFTPYDDPDVELAYPAGAWIQPPPGRYRHWLQGDWQMTPFAGLLIFSGHSGGSMKVFSPLGDAGRVTLRENDRNPDRELHLLHAGSYHEAGFLRWEISPRRAVEEIGDGVLLPVGRAIGALWDQSEKRYVALSRPFEVYRRKTVEIPLERPSGAVHLVAELLRHPMPESAEDLTAELVVKRDGRELPPDLKVLTADKIFAAWYGLRPGEAELRARSRQTFFDQKLDLVPGNVEWVKGQLEPRPALDVELDLPAPLRRDERILEVRRLPSGEPVARHSLETGKHEHRFEGLPPTLLAVDLQTSLGTFTRQVDLSSKQDGFLLLKPELVTLRGTVYRGDEGHPAKLTFTTVDRKTREVQADEEGLYEIAFLERVGGVSIELANVDAAPYIDFFLPAIKESQDLDFHLSDAEHRVRVLDAATGQGVSGASLAIRNSFVREDAEEEESKGALGKKERAVFQSVRTDERGEARLPPLREGSIEIRASAEGYSPLREPLRAQVVDGETDQTFEILLEPVGETVALRLSLPDGAPATGAHVLLVDSLATGQSLFSARADGEGLVEVPRKQSGILLVRHAAAAFLVREWLPEEDEAGWALPPAAGLPLMIHVKDSSGRSALPKADLALWVDGRRLDGRWLAWLMGGAEPRADANGYWTGRNLPRGTVEILAWGPGAREEALAGSLDAQATGVRFPWADPVEVRAVE